MATYYVDPVNGSDANTGLIATLPRKSQASSTTSDIVKYKASPAPVAVAGGCMATWVDGVKYVDVAWTSGQAPFYLIDTGLTPWTAVATKTGAMGTPITGKNPISPFRSNGINTIAGATAGKFAYLPLGSVLNLSAYQKISFWFKVGTNGNLGWQIKLCSDTTGDVAVNTFTLPDAFMTTSNGNRFYMITLDNGSALGSSIQSIALYNTGTNAAASVITIDAITVFANTADCLSSASLIGKGTLGETWYGIGYISDYTATGCKLWLDGGVADAGSAFKGYSANTSGLSETLVLKKREPFTYQQMGVISSAITLNISRNGALGAPSVFEGGYSDFSLSAPDGETWFDGQCQTPNVIQVTGSFNAIRNISVVRAAQSFSLTLNYGSELVNAHSNHCQTGAVLNTTGKCLFRIVAANNNTNGISSNMGNSDLYIDSCSNNSNVGFQVTENCRVRPYNRGYALMARNGVSGNANTGAITVLGQNTIFYNADLRDNAYNVCWISYRGTSIVFYNCKINFITEFLGAKLLANNGYCHVYDYNQVASDSRIYLTNGSVFTRSGNEYKCGAMLSPNAAANSPSVLKIAEFSAVSGQPVSITLEVKRSSTASSAFFGLNDDVENSLVTSTTTAAAANTYETIALNYTPVKTGFLRLYWNSWTTATTGTNEVTIKNLKVSGMAASLSFKNFGMLNGALPVTPNATGGAAAQIGSAFIPLLEIPMQQIKPGQTAYFEFPVQDSAGAAVTPDSVATKFRRNNTQDVAVTPTITTGAGFGLGSVVVPAGYALDDQLSVEVQATVGGVAGAWTPVWRGKVADVAGEVWGATTRTLSGFGFTVNTAANATQTAIKAKTDLIGSSVATQTSVDALAANVASVATQSSLNTLAANVATQSSLNALAANVATQDSLDEVADDVIEILSNQNSEGEGPNEVGITVTDGTSPLQNAAVRLSINTQFYTATTDANGEAVFGVHENGEYRLVVSLAGYEYTPQTITVGGDTTATAVMTQRVITPPTDPEKVPVYGTTRDFLGDAVETSVVLRYIDSNVVAGEAFVIVTGGATSSDADGFFEFAGGALPSSAISPPKKGATHQISFINGGVERTFKLRIGEEGGNLAEMLVG